MLAVHAGGAVRPFVRRPSFLITSHQKQQPPNDIEAVVTERRQPARYGSREWEGWWLYTRPAQSPRRSCPRRQRRPPKPAATWGPAPYMRRSVCGSSFREKAKYSGDIAHGESNGDRGNDSQAGPGWVGLGLGQLGPAGPAGPQGQAGLGWGWLGPGIPNNNNNICITTQ